jgi:hypothetical protein
LTVALGSGRVTRAMTTAAGGEDDERQNEDIGQGAAAPDWCGERVECWLQVLPWVSLRLWSIRVLRLRA